MAAIKLFWDVEYISNVMLVYDQMKVYRSTTGMNGTYSEITGPGTRIDLVADQTRYEFIDTAGDASYWYKFAYFDSVSLAEGSLSGPISGADTGGLYCSIQDLRDEGIPDTVLSDARAAVVIRRASRLIERLTGNWFEVRPRTFRVKANGTTVVHLGAPIIMVSSVNLVSGRGTSITRDSVPIDDVLVFNRHLTEGLEDPDDRATPRLEYLGAWGIDYPGRDDFEWPEMSQVVEIEGLFGYTELEPSDPVGETSDGSQVPLSYGQTPELIKQACMMLIMKDLYPLGDVARRESLRDRNRIIEEKTADQSYKKESLKNLGMTGTLTGDADIDGILVQYMATPGMGAV